MTNWPKNEKFALFLSHDVDQIYDRELFHFLATLNHIKRMMLSGERGSCKNALSRLLRIVFNPKPVDKDFRTILNIESKYGFKSTFFLLHDPYWCRHGARYSISSPQLKSIVDLIKETECEIGLHGGYYRFNDAEKYRESRELLEETFDIEVSGIRNHLLRFSGNETWDAQQKAGFKYDATFGYSERPGARDDKFFPFKPDNMDLTVLPLTVMDATLFRNMNLNLDQALETAWKAIEPVIEKGGLVSLLWHNNFFNEPEYAEWQACYELLLERLAEFNPWNATGGDIARWAMDG